MKVRRGRGRNQLLDDLHEKKAFWTLNKEVLARTVWRTGLLRVCGHFVRCTAVRVVKIIILDRVVWGTSNGQR